jgi:hypothetical protein
MGRHIGKGTDMGIGGGSWKRVVSGSLRIPAVVAAFVLAQAAGAAEPAPSGQVLGTIEAVISHCSKVDAASAAKYQQQLKLIVQGADEEALAEVRNSDEYKQAYQAATDQLGDATGDEARRNCAKSLAENK